MTAARFVYWSDPWLFASALGTRHIDLWNQSPVSGLSAVPHRGQQVQALPLFRLIPQYQSGGSYS